MPNLPPRGSQVYTHMCLAVVGLLVALGTAYLILADGCRQIVAVGLADYGAAALVLGVFFALRAADWSRRHRR